MKPVLRFQDKTITKESTLFKYCQNTKENGKTNQKKQYGFRHEKHLKPSRKLACFLKEGLTFDYSLSSKERLLSCPTILLISL